MTRTLTILAAAAGLALAGCNSNSAPGNDKEAALEAPAKAAPHVAAGEALAGVATATLQPETMTPADLASLGGIKGRCVFRMTEIGYPSFVYGGGSDSGTIKLNGKLITLASAGEGLYSADGLRLGLKPVDAKAKPGEPRETELVVMLPGAKDELGFRGYSQCPS